MDKLVISLFALFTVCSSASAGATEVRYDFESSRQYKKTKEFVDAQLNFKSTDEDALVLFEVPGPNEFALFREVDVVKGRFLGRNIDFQLLKQGSTPLKRYDDKEPIRYYLRRMKAGDYALVGVGRWRHFTAGSTHITSCFSSGAPVFRLQAGKVNYVSAPMARYSELRQFDETDALPDGRDNPLEHVKYTVSGYPTIEAEVIQPVVVSNVQFPSSRTSPFGKGVSCPKGRKFEALDDPAAAQ